MSKEYILPVGEADRIRLEVLGRMYNPLAEQFLIKNGLKPGMHVLEIGCGAGDMACWLANYVGGQGKVTAIDSSSKQIDIASSKAKDSGINNIEFHCLDMREIESLDQQFDLIYGRWVIFFCPNQDEIFKTLFNVLKPSGVLTYETASHVGKGDFSYPCANIAHQWFENSYRFFIQNHYCPDLGNQLHGIFTRLGLIDIDLMVNQPIMVTAEEKSVMRLASIGIKNELLKFMSEQQYEDYIQQFIDFEQSDAIAGFYRNILAAGVKQAS